MEYRVLGSLEVLDGSGERVPLGGTRQQTVLGSLLLRAGRTVPLDLLVEELWEKPPETAAKTVQVYVSRLRRLLSPGAIESRAGGYALVIDGDRLDLTRFERLADEGRSALGAADCERAASLLREALALWRGPALGGLPAEALRREADRLEESRLQVLEDRLEADLARGREREVVPELRALVAEHPFRERLRAQLMRGLYAAGRQTDALEVYRETRTLLDEELGLEPGAELRAARAPDAQPRPGARARRSGERAPHHYHAVAGPSPHEPVRGRRPTTVVFADVVDSTTLGELLDPESVHRILERYSEIARKILERHGGEIEKFIGDAVVAFFGMTELHEDDALRAVRAAIELREAVTATPRRADGGERGRARHQDRRELGGRLRRRRGRARDLRHGRFRQCRGPVGAGSRSLGDPARGTHVPAGRGRRPRGATRADRGQGSVGAGARVEAARPGRGGAGPRARDDAVRRP